MHKIATNCLEMFLKDAYGDDLWQSVADAAGFDSGDLLNWHGASEEVAESIFVEASARLGKSRQEFLEDMGAWLTHQEPIRRLLRFSGGRFYDFLGSLREIVPRIKMVLPDIGISNLRVSTNGTGSYCILGKEEDVDFIWIISGAIRGMADDYGALAVISTSANSVNVDVALPEFSERRGFSLF